MLKKVYLVFALVCVLLLATAGVVFAGSDGPVAGCPPRFELHNLADHMDHEHHELPAGKVLDRNGDGYVCVKHVMNNGVMMHAHTDNKVPFN